MEAADPPSSLEEAFDFSWPVVIHDWEVQNIRDAVENGSHYVSGHAEDASIDEDIPIEEFENIILMGKAKTKDLPGNPEERKPGINFEGKIMKDKKAIRVRVKVSWYKGRYTLATVHSL